VSGKGLIEGVLLSLCLIGTSASAETTREALNNFGLVGTWSTDCSKDVEKQVGFRGTYTAPMFGPAVLVSMTRQADNRTIFLKKEVERAVRITDEKIQVTLKPLETKINGADALHTEEILSTTFVFTFQKVGSKIRTIDSRSPDGKYISVEGGRFSNNGNMTPFLERCLN
jgi:hypothetical protein